MPDRRMPKRLTKPKKSEVKWIIKLPPKGKGKIDVFVEMIDGRNAGVVIIGDPKGLRYLAEIMMRVAALDQDKSPEETDPRQHVHLHRGVQLGSYSCEVEISRADAKGTGLLPDFMRGGK
jgi:hypothetical protein